MKEPKTFKYPRLYYQAAEVRQLFYDKDLVPGDRIRIIYPDGTSEWLLDGDPDKSYPPCWAEYSQNIAYSMNSLSLSSIGVSLSAEQAVRCMHNYDKRVGFSKAVFLGELK